MVTSDFRHHSHSFEVGFVTAKAHAFSAIIRTEVMNTRAIELFAAAPDLISLNPSQRDLSGGSRRHAFENKDGLS
jgi:hypothetical protein